MATGFDRRGQTQSPFGEGVNLAQQAGLQGNVAVPGVSRPAGINVQPVDTTIMDGLAEWGGKAIQDQAAKQMNASLLDGQMAHAQGESFDQVETGGDKWKIEGFHQMEAATMSAQLLEAQKAEISNSAYSLSPDQYRAQFNTRVEAMLEGKDPRVQEMVRKQIAGQIPVLAGAQTGAYTNYAAQRTYEAGVQAVHAISQDSTGDAALAAIADPGPNSPLAALGPNERRSAITDGVLFAFQNDNPGAYIKMKAAGTFNDFTPEQQARIEASRKDWMARMAAQFDPVRMQAFTEFNTKLDLGEFATPMDAVNAAKGMYDKFGLDFDNQQAWQVQTAALTGIGMANQTTSNNIQTAAISGDMNAVASMVAPALFNMESGGNYSAQGPVLNRPNGSSDRAYGKYQIMGANLPQWTREALGRELTPAQFLADPRAQDIVFQHRFGGYVQQRIAAGQQPMDAVRDAISMWHSGRPYDKAVADGAADVNMSTQNYTDKIMGDLVGMPTGASRLAASETALGMAQNERAVADYSQMAPQRDELDQLYVTGQLSQTDWQSQRGALYEKYHMQRTTGDVDNEIAITHAAQKQAAEAGLGAAASQYGMQMAEAEATMRSVVDSDMTSMAEKRQAITDYGNTRQQLVTQLGLPRNPDQEFGFYRGLQDTWSKAVAAEEINGPKRMAVARAAETGTLGSDPSIDPKFRDKWYQDVLKGAQTEAARLIAKDPKYTPQANAGVQSAVMDKLAKAGFIPDGMSARYTAAVEGNLVDRNGNPTPEAIASVQDYMAMAVKNPRVAGMMFGNDKARSIASQIAEMAGQDPNGVQSAITAFNNMPPIIAGLKSAGELEAAPELQSAVADRVYDFTRQNGMTAWERLDMFATAPNSTALTNAVQAEAAKRWAAAGGKGDPTPHVKSAIQDLGARTTNIGGVMVTAPAGVDVMNETFGGADMSGDPDAMDKAIRMFVMNNAGNDLYGIPPDIAIPWQDRPTEVDSFESAIALPFVGIGKYATQAGSWMLSPLKSDAGSTGMFNFDMEMVPNTIERRSDGTYVTVTLTDAVNYGKMVTIPLAEAGRAYTQWRTKTAYTP